MNPKYFFPAFFAIILCLCLAPDCLGQSPRSFAEVHVVRSLRQIHSAQATYQATTGSGNFGSLQNLQQAGLIDDALASGSKYGYLYVVTTIPFVPGQSAARFTVTATPRSYRKSGFRSFYIDALGEIHGGDKNGQIAVPGDPFIDDCTSGTILDNERCIIADMRLLYSAEMTYAATIGNQSFAVLQQLYAAGLISSRIAQGSTRGYLFTYTIYNFPDLQIWSFTIRATPQIYGTTAIRSFFIDKTGILRGGDKNGAEANENDPPIIQ